MFLKTNILVSKVSYITDALEFKRTNMCFKTNPQFIGNLIRLLFFHRILLPWPVYDVPRYAIYISSLPLLYVSCTKTVFVLDGIVIDSTWLLGRYTCRLFGSAEQEFAAPTLINLLPHALICVIVTGFFAGRKLNIIIIVVCQEPVWR